MATSILILLQHPKVRKLGFQEIEVSFPGSETVQHYLGVEEQEPTCPSYLQEQVPRHLQRGEQVRGLDKRTRTSLCPKTGKWENCPGPEIWPIEAPTRVKSETFPRNLKYYEILDNKTLQNG